MKLSKSRQRRRRPKSPDGTRNVYYRSSKSFESDTVKMRLDNVNDVVDFEYKNKATGYSMKMHIENNKPVIHYDDTPTVDDINLIKNFIPKEMIPFNLFIEDDDQ